MIEKLVTLRCIAEDEQGFKYYPKNFFVSNEIIDPDDIGDLLCGILNDKPLDDANFYVENVQDPATEEDINVPSEEPDYYAKNGLSPLKAFEKGLLSREEYEGFVKGNVIKYTVRLDKKEDPIKDIDKAVDYLLHLKDLYVEEQRR